MKNLTNFFKKIGTKWIDENTIIKFINAGYSSIKEIINATKDDLLELESFGEKMAEKIYNSIQESLKDIELVDLMNGSNIFGNGFGKKKLGAILKVYPDIVDKKINKDKLTKGGQRSLMRVSNLYVNLRGLYCAGVFDSFHAVIVQDFSKSHNLITYSCNLV